MEKMLLKVSIMLLTAACCLFGGQVGSAQESEPWQKDWQKFGEAIAPYARAGALELRDDTWKFNRTFSQEVEWRGTLMAVHKNSVAKSLILDMQPIRISLPDGGAVEIKRLSLSCVNEKRGCGGWSAELIGKEVIFRTSLINRTRGIQPVVRLEGIGEGPRRVVIATYGAELVKVVSE
jgi:hypothetical protein